MERREPTVLNETRIHLGAQAAVRRTERMSSAQHTQHAVTLLVADDAEICVHSAGRTFSGRVLLVPADLCHGAECPGPAVAVLFDPEATGARSAVGADPRVVEGALGRRLGDIARGTGASLAGVAIESARALALGRPPRRDRRVDAVLERLRADDVTDLYELARATGASAPHLRALFARDVGISLRRYRLWRRLASAVARAQSSPAESATRLSAEAGFADVAHLTRTSRALVGYSLTALFGGARRG